MGFVGAVFTYTIIYTLNIRKDQQEQLSILFSLHRKAEYTIKSQIWHYCYSYVPTNSIYIYCPNALPQGFFKAWCYRQHVKANIVSLHCHYPVWKRFIQVHNGVYIAGKTSIN